MLVLFLNLTLYASDRDIPYYCRNWKTLYKYYHKFFPDKSKSKKQVQFWDLPLISWYVQNDNSSKVKKEEREKKCILNLSFITPQFLENLPAGEYKKLMDELMDYAVSYPTPQNVQVFMLAQWYARERAVKFMNAWQEVLNAHPALDYTIVRPPFGYATKVQTLYRHQRIEKFLHSLGQRDDIAVIAFVSPDCLYCVQQMPILLNLQKQYGIRVKFVNVKEHEELIKKYHIEALPDIWLAVKDYGMERISAGLRTLDTIINRLIKVYENITGEKIFMDIYRKEKVKNIEYNRYFKPYSPETDLMH